MLTSLCAGTFFDPLRAFCQGRRDFEKSELQRPLYVNLYVKACPRHQHLHGTASKMSVFSFTLHLDNTCFNTANYPPPKTKRLIY